MGSSKPEKKSTKKIRKRSKELLHRGDSGTSSIPFETKDKSRTIDKNKEDPAGADFETRKLKKARKDKKKVHLSSGEENKLVHGRGVIGQNEEEDGTNGIKRKQKKAHKSKKDRSSANEVKDSVQKTEAEQDYQISPAEDDCSRGMKKWIKEYHENRPGMEVLQQRIDEFITAYEAQEEQARKEREAQAAEGGWTVVVHRKGGKKTSDPESGVAVGSVAAAAVVDNMAKKKSKDVGLDFYRFQRREAQRNEVMKLQSKFEEDKKRIQQLRAARKFKPY